MTVQPSPYDLLRGLQDQIAVLHASLRAVDRAANTLAGMLDGSAPDPVLDWRPSRPAVEPPPRKVVAPLAGPSPARPGAVLEIDGKTVLTTKRRATLLSMVMTAPQTLDAMARAGVSPTVAGMKAQIRDANGDLERAGVTRVVRMQALPDQRRGAKGGREAALYALLPPKCTNADPENPPSAQNEGEAGSSPGQEASDGAVGEGDVVAAAHDAPFVMPTGGEGSSSVESPPAADAKPQSQPGAFVGRDRVLDMWRDTDASKLDIARQIGISRTTVVNILADARASLEPRVLAGDAVRIAAKEAAPIPKSDDALPIVPASPPAAPAPPRAVLPESKPAAKPAPTPARAGALKVEPGDLLAVDVKQKRIQTKAGAYEVGGVNLARALEMMKGGQLFGLDVIAKRAGWPSADVAKTALGFERNRLAEHGVELYLDKHNARLRTPA